MKALTILITLLNTITTLNDEYYLYSVNTKSFLSYDNGRNEELIHFEKNFASAKTYILEEDDVHGRLQIKLASTNLNQNPVLDIHGTDKTLIAFLPHGGRNQKFELKLIGFNLFRMEVEGYCVTVVGDKMKGGPNEKCKKKDEGTEQLFRLFQKPRLGATMDDFGAVRGMDENEKAELKLLREEKSKWEARMEEESRMREQGYEREGYGREGYEREGYGQGLKAEEGYNGRFGYEGGMAFRRDGFRDEAAQVGYRSQVEAKDTLETDAVKEDCCAELYKLKKYYGIGYTDTGDIRKPPDDESDYDNYKRWKKYHDMLRKDRIKDVLKKYIIEHKEDEEGDYVDMSDSEDKKIRKRSIFGEKGLEDGRLSCVAQIDPIDPICDDEDIKNKLEQLSTLTIRPFE